MIAAVIAVLTTIAVFAPGVVVESQTTEPPIPNAPNGTASRWCLEPATLLMTPAQPSIGYSTMDLSKMTTNFSIEITDVWSNLFITAAGRWDQLVVNGASLNTVTFHNLTHIYVTLTAPQNEGLDLYKNHPVTVYVKATGFMCLGTNLGRASAMYTYRKVKELVPKELTDTTQAVATTAGAVSGIASSSTLATQTARASMVLALTQCKFSHTTKLDSQQSPTGYRFGSANGGYYRGGIVGNMCVMLASALIMLLVSIGMFLCWSPFRTQGLKGLRIAAERVHFPGLLIVPFATLLPGTAMCAMALAIHGHDTETDIVLSTITFVYLFGVIGFFGFRITAGFGAEWVPDEMEYSNGEVKAGPELPLWHRSFHGSHKWADGGNNFKNAYGSLFKDYRKQFAWFMCIELGATVASGILDGIRPTDGGGCLNVGIGFLVVNFLLAVPAVFIRPCATIYNTVHLIVNTVLILISSIFLVISQIGEGDDTQALIATWTSTVVIYLAFGKAGIDVMLCLQKVYWGLLAYKRKKARKAKEETEGNDADKAADKKPLLGIKGDDTKDSSEDSFDDGDGKKVEMAHTAGGSSLQKGGEQEQEGEANLKGQHAEFSRFSIDENDLREMRETEDDPNDDFTDDDFKHAARPQLGLQQPSTARALAMRKDSEGQRLHDEIRFGVFKPPTATEPLSATQRTAGPPLAATPAKQRQRAATVGGAPKVTRAELLVDDEFSDLL